MNKSPERYILAAALLILAGGVAGLAVSFPSPSDITGIVGSNQQVHIAKKLKEEEITAAEVDLNTPATWQIPANHHQLFISDGYIFYASLYPNGNYIQKDDGKAKTAGGVLISWYRKYGLNFQDPNIDRQDPDNDGFSNKMEYLNEQSDITKVDETKSTDPTDPASHPSYISRLRLEKYDAKPFHIQFLGVQPINGKNFFQIRLSDIPSSQQPDLKQEGDQLGFDNYVIGPYHEIFEEVVDPGTGLKQKVNKSTLELDRPEIGFKIELVYRQEVDSPESTANFVMLMPAYVGKTIKTPVASTFELPYVPGSKYLVLNAGEKGADIRDTKTNQQIHIPKLAAGEWDDVPAATGTADNSASAKTQ